VDLVKECIWLGSRVITSVIQDCCMCRILNESLTLFVSFASKDNPAEAGSITEEDLFRTLINYILWVHVMNFLPMIQSKRWFEESSSSYQLLATCCRFS